MQTALPGTTEPGVKCPHQSKCFKSYLSQVDQTLPSNSRPNSSHHRSCFNTNNSKLCLQSKVLSFSGVGSLLVSLEPKKCTEMSYCI